MWRYYKKTFCLINLVLLSALTFTYYSPNAAAETTITSPGLTITLDNDSSFNFDLTPDIFSSKTQNISISTTSIGGYTISFKTAGYKYTDAQNNPQTILTTDLVNTTSPTDTTKRIPTILSQQGNNGFNNNYGYNFTKLANPPATTTWHPAPAIVNNIPTQVTLAETNTKNTTADNYALTFGTKVDNSTPAGNYQNNFEINVTAKVVPYEVVFNGNGATSGSMANQSIGVGIPTTLTPNSYQKTNYEFAGWNTKADGTGTSYINEYNTENGEVNNATSGATINLYAQWVCPTNKICYDDNGASAEGTTASPSMGNQAIDQSATDITLWASNFKRSGYGFAGWNTAPDGKGTNYGPNQTIADITTLNDIKTNGITLYAMWIKSQGDLQSWNGCSAMSIGDTTALTDNRDGNTYAIAKLADGKCWMIENMRLSNTHTETGDPVAIDATNTNNPASGFTLNASQNPETNLWCTSDTATCINQSLHATNNTQNPMPSMTDPGTNVYSYGNYYNWYTATAGNGTYSMTSGNTAGDICPAGWHLPTGGASGEYKALNDALGGDAGATGSNALRSYPNNNLHSGYATGSLLYYRANYGGYWSSMAYSNSRTDGMYLHFNYVNINTDNGLFKYRGFAVHCILSTTYVINFDSNGGSGNMSPQTLKPGETANLSANTFTRTGFKFTGWNTDPSGNGTSYTNEQSVTDLASAGGSITLYAQWSPVITYDPNGASAEGTTESPNMGDQTIDQSATDVTLWASNFKRPDYGFAGWNTKADGTGASYGPNQTITDATVINDIKTNGLVLYAIWKQSTGDLQSWTPASCNAMNIGDTTALTDNRDGNTYAIAKLADGKCWIVENLRLSNTHTTTSQPVTINSTNTNNPASGFALNAPQDPTSSAWCANNDAACINQTLHATNNIEDTVPTMTDPNSNVYSYGNYYNWYTATAGNGTYSMDSGNTGGDICPAGWHIPKGRAAVNGGEFAALDIVMGGTGDTQTTAEASNRWRTFQNNNLYSGYVYGSSLYGRSSFGNYWSPTVRSSYIAYDLYFNSSGVRPGTYNDNKYSGLSVRCMLGS